MTTPRGYVTIRSLFSTGEKRVDHAAHMQLALDEARLAAAAGEVPIGAVLVVGEAVVARAHNRREVWQDPTAHAELIAIREASAQLRTWRLTGGTLYVTMEPCAMCIGAALLARLDRVVFGVWDPKGGACGSVLNVPEEKRLNHRIDVIGGVLEQESRELLQGFFKNLRVKTDEKV
ncbi:MAG: nucleoside deaminase [Nitrospirae bacterium]|nr:MAG: nucleoside deaminase [Nitrospirota bacterium]